MLAFVGQGRQIDCFVSWYVTLDRFRQFMKSGAYCREEVETRKIGRNETRTFQGLFLGCTRENEKLGKEPNRIVSFLMKRAPPSVVAV